MDERKDWHLTDALHHEQGRGDPFAAAVRATRMPMIITDPKLPDNPIVFANEAFQKLTGYDREEILGRNCRLLQGAETDPDAINAIRTAIADGGDIEIDLLNYRKDGSAFWNALYLSPVRDDTGDIQFFFASQLDVTARIDAQSRIARQKRHVEQQVEKRTADLQSALDAQKLLLHEVDHRVKNNMTMIGSILRLQLREVSDEDSAHQMRAMMSRIDALATVHRRLYQSDDVTRFDIGAYAVNLAGDLVRAVTDRDIGLVTDVRRAEIPAGQAAVLGLIVNEILTNCVRHAFAVGDEGHISIFARAEESRVLLSIADNGMGSTRRDQPAAGLGGIIIERLSKQAGTQVTWQTDASGTRADLTIKSEVT
ncbi:PAS domain-containing protein [Paracoccus laeviglucosivorans]|uniref:PAS domain S-box-containing protein n=1 Tax=Paracoccus laeviglucosivorans TaxID=1197861 RepID=A0A521FR06_9RHOB|nr:PAS domain-containing protein [Paracoccus laeviglucosivorans]SMO98556.1 PAS domain S-box-containing protein [Paracoccus laeviglucosivorans]